MTAIKVIRRFRELKDVEFGTPADGDAVVYDAGTDELVLQPGGSGTPGPPGPQGPQGDPGPTGPAGPSGQSAGRIFYYATSDPSDIAGYKTMLEAPSAGAEQTVATPCSGTGDVLVAAFATDPGIPGAVDYPAGTAFRRVYAKVDRGTARLHLQVYKRDLAGTETLVRDEFSPTFGDTAAALQEWIATASGGGALLATDRIVNKLYAQRVAGTAPVTVTTYYEGSTHGSHIQTTISAGAQGPPGPTGPAASVPTDTIWNVKGDLAVATANDTAVGVAVGSNGQVLTADSAQAAGVKWAAVAAGDPIPWVWVTKAVDESVASSGAVQNDDELFFVTTVGAHYEISCFIIYASPAGAGTPDFKVAFGEDSTARGAMMGSGFTSTDSGNLISVKMDQADPGTFGTAVADRTIRVSGGYSANGGTFRVRWAQATAGANATIVRAGSVLRYRRIV